MEALDRLGTKITYEAKTIFGVLGIILGFIFWAIAPYIGLINIIFIIIPAILLVIPSETVKNSKILGIIFIILLLIGISSLSASYDYIPGDLYTGVAGSYAATESAITLQILLSIYCLFCAILLIIPSQHKNVKVINQTPVITNKSEKSYDKFCSECGNGLYENTKFCPECGAEVTNDVPEESTENNEEETAAKQCSECGKELYEDSKFCPECGAEVSPSDEETAE